MLSTVESEVGGTAVGTAALRVQIQVDWVLLSGVIVVASSFLRTSCDLVIIRQKPVFPLDARITEGVPLSRYF